MNKLSSIETSFSQIDMHHQLQSQESMQTTPLLPMPRTIGKKSSKEVLIGESLFKPALVASPSGIYVQNSKKPLRTLNPVTVASQQDKNQ
jgi:hypothetical protein